MNSSARTATKADTETAESVRTRPIIFSPELVRAILDNRKSQTRRIVKPQPFWNHNARPPQIEWPSSRKGHTQYFRDEADMARYCNYGVAGDRLWVREAWFPAQHALLYRKQGSVIYRCDKHPEGFYSPPGGWRPSIHMPRWASRITLEITKVRVERLQDISEEDAKAEGIFNGEYDPGLADGGKPGWCYAQNRYAGSPQHAYELLWDSLHGKGAWEKNPWVFVIEFKRLTRR